MQDEELGNHKDKNRQQMELKSLVEGIQKQSEVAVHKAEEKQDVKIMKLTERDDIEAYRLSYHT